MTREHKPPLHTDISLSDEAIDWIVRLSSGRATAQDQAEFAKWRRNSRSHELAAREAEALWHGIGSAGRQIRKSTRKTQITRRAILGSLTLVAGGIALKQTGLTGAHFYADHVTGLGEQRTIRLADGSDVFLNANSALSVQMSAHERRLILWRGQALFTVAKDAARPFIVEAEQGQTRAVGTVFDIDIKPQQVVVTVLEGTVSVTADAQTPTPAHAQASVLLQENQRIRYADNTLIAMPETIDADFETAWRRGKLVFNARPLGDVVAEIERYRSGTIFIADYRLRSLEVTGVFDLSKPDEILQTIEASLPVSVIRLPFVTILR